jgi:hypothetical protein
MKVRNPSDGRVHFSQLKNFGRSPAHYKTACERPWQPTRAMRIGTVAHRIILGARPGHEITIWDGDRRGKAWMEFAAEHKGEEIITMTEVVEAQAIADSALASPVLAELLEGARCEVPLAWTDAGIECATAGVDILRDRDGVLADLKTCNTTEPRRWSAQALSMSYHAQLAFADTGARANGFAPRRHLLIGIEATPPHCVVVLELTPAMLAEGRKAIVLWLERLRSCEENDCWPGYTDSVVALDLPPWMAGDDVEGDVLEGEGELLEAAS